MKMVMFNAYHVKTFYVLMSPEVTCEMVSEATTDPAVDSDLLNNIVNNLMNNLTTPLSTINLHSTTHSQPHTTATKQRSTSPRIDAQIKVQVGTVLVSARQSILRTQRVAL